jgi:hypothetical protein
LDCDELGIPPHLHRNRRRKKPHFDNAELLYRRFETLDKGGKPDITKIKPIRGLSTNRESLCQSPEDVLYEGLTGLYFPKWGVFSFRVGLIRSFQLIHPETNDTFTFNVAHEPIQCMFPHSEITVIKNGNILPYDDDLPKPLRRRFRRFLRNECDIPKLPN